MNHDNRFCVVVYTDEPTTQQKVYDILFKSEKEMDNNKIIGRNYASVRTTDRCHFIVLVR